MNKHKLVYVVFVKEGPPNPGYVNYQGQKHELIALRSVDHLPDNLGKWSHGTAHVSGCQNHGPFLGTLNIRCRIIVGIQKGTIILTTTHVGA